MDRARRRAARRAQARRYRGGGYGGQHRHRTRPCVQRSGIPLRDRHARQPGGGKVSDHRGPWGGASQGARGPLQQSEPVPESCGAARRRAAQCDLGEPVRQHSQSHGACRVDRPGNLARHRRQGRRVLRGYGDGRHARGRCGLPEVPIPVGPNRAGRSARSALYHYFKDGELKTDGGSSITRGDRHRARDREPRRRAHRRCDPHPGCRDAALRLPADARRGLIARQHGGDQRGGGCRDREANRPGHTIVTVLCDGGAKYQSRLFNPAWIEERGFTEAIGRAKR